MKNCEFFKLEEMKYDFLLGCSQCLHLTKGKFSVCRKMRLTRTACTRNNKWEVKKKNLAAAVLSFLSFSFDSRVQFWLPDREYEGHRRRAGSHHTNRRVGFGSVCRSIRRSVSVCLSLAGSLGTEKLLAVRRSARAKICRRPLDEKQVLFAVLFKSRNAKWITIYYSRFFIDSHYFTAPPFSLPLVNSRTGLQLKTWESTCCLRHFYATTIYPLETLSSENCKYRVYQNFW